MDGMLVIDKPAGITSSKMLAPLRRIVRKEHGRVGHTGTLDPFATGILLVLLGDATRLADLAVALPKLYDTTIRFGKETTTLDPEGDAVMEQDPGTECPPGLREALRGFEGEILQTPPEYSAVKIAGEPAYKLARRGASPPLRARPVLVHSIEILESLWPDVRMSIRCGPGMYVRSLARDLGRTIGIPASLARLHRVAVGPFSDRLAVTFDPQVDLETDWVVSHLRPSLELTEAAGLPTVRLARSEAIALAHGNPANAPRGLQAPLGAKVALVVGETSDDRPRLFGLGCVEPGGGIRPETILARASKRLLRGEEAR